MVQRGTPSGGGLNAAYGAGEDLVQCALCTDDVKRNLWDNNVHIRTTHLMKSNIGTATDPLIRYRNSAGLFTCECGQAFVDSDALPEHVRTTCPYKGPRYHVGSSVQSTQQAAPVLPPPTRPVASGPTPPLPPPRASQPPPVSSGPSAAPRPMPSQSTQSSAMASSSLRGPNQASLGLGRVSSPALPQGAQMKRSGSAASTGSAQGQRHPSRSLAIGSTMSAQNQHPPSGSLGQAPAGLAQQSRSSSASHLPSAPAGPQRPTSAAPLPTAGPPRSRTPNQSVRSSLVPQEVETSADRKPVIQPGLQPVMPASASSRPKPSPPPPPLSQQPSQPQQNTPLAQSQVPALPLHQQYDLQEQLRLARLLQEEQARHIEQLQLAESMQRRIELLRSYQQQHAEQQQEHSRLLQAELEAAGAAGRYDNQAAQIEVEQQARQRAQRELQQDIERQAKRRADALAQQEAQRQAELKQKQQVQQEADLRSQREAEQQAQREADLRSQREAELQAQREAELQAQQAAQLRARREAERREAERQRAQQSAQAQKQAQEAQLRLEAKQRAQKETERQAHLEARREAQRKEDRRQSEKNLRQTQLDHQHQQEQRQHDFQQHQQQIHQQQQQQQHQQHQQWLLQWQQEMQRRAGGPSQPLAQTQQAFFPDRHPNPGGSARPLPSDSVPVNAVAGPSRLTKAFAPPTQVASVHPPIATAPSASTERTAQELADALQMHLIQLLSTGRKAVGDAKSYGHLQVRGIPGAPLAGELPADCVACKSIRTTSANMSPLEQEAVWRTHYGLQHWACCQLVLASDDGQQTFPLFPSNRAPNGLWVCPVCAALLSTDARQLAVHLKSDCPLFRQAMLIESTNHAAGAQDLALPNDTAAIPVDRSLPTAVPAPKALSHPSSSFGQTIQINPIASPPIGTLTSSPIAPIRALSPGIGPRPIDRGLPSSQSAATGREPAPPNTNSALPSNDSIFPTMAPPVVVASAPSSIGDAPKPTSAHLDAAVPPSAPQLPAPQSARSTSDFAKFSADNYRFFGSLFLSLLQSGTPVDRRHLFMVAARIASVRDLHVRLHQAVNVLLKRVGEGPLGPSWSSAHSDRLVQLHKASALEGPDAITGEKEDQFRLKHVVTLLLEYPLHLKETVDYIQQWFPIQQAGTKPSPSYKTAWTLFKLVSTFVQQYRGPSVDLPAALVAARIKVPRDGQRPYVLSPVKWDKVARSLLRWAEAVWNWWGVLDEMLKTSILPDVDITLPADGDLDGLLEAVNTLLGQLPDSAATLPIAQPSPAMAPTVLLQDMSAEKTGTGVAPNIEPPLPLEAAKAERLVVTPAAQLATSDDASAEAIPLDVGKTAVPAPLAAPLQSTTPRESPPVAETAPAQGKATALLSTSSSAALSPVAQPILDRSKTKMLTQRSQLPVGVWSPSADGSELSTFPLGEPVAIGWSPRAYAVPPDAPVEARGLIRRVSVSPVVPNIPLPSSPVIAPVTTVTGPSALEPAVRPPSSEPALRPAHRTASSSELASLQPTAHNTPHQVASASPVAAKSSTEPPHEPSTPMAEPTAAVRAAPSSAVIQPQQSVAPQLSETETCGQVDTASASAGVAPPAPLTHPSAPTQASLPTPPKSPPAPAPDKGRTSAANVPAPTLIAAPPPPALTPAPSTSAPAPVSAPAAAPAPDAISTIKSVPASALGASSARSPLPTAPPATRDIGTTPKATSSKAREPSKAHISRPDSLPSGELQSKHTSPAPIQALASTAPVPRPASKEVASASTKVVPALATSFDTRPAGSTSSKKLAFKRTHPKDAAALSEPLAKASTSTIPPVKVPSSQVKGSDQTDTAVCNNCIPPLSFSSLQRKEAHNRVMHFWEMTLKDPAGWPHYIQRSADGRFHCRAGCPVNYKNRDPEKLRKHMRAEEHFPWSAGAARAPLPAPTAAASISSASAPRLQTASVSRPAAPTPPLPEPASPPPRKLVSPWRKKRKQSDDPASAAATESISTRASPRISRASTPRKAVTGSSRQLGSRASKLADSSPQPPARKKARHSRVIKLPPTSEVDSAPPRVKSKRLRVGSDSEEEQKWKPSTVPITLDDSDADSDIIVM